MAVQHVANQVMADYGLTGIFNLIIGRGAEIGEKMINDKHLNVDDIDYDISVLISFAYGKNVFQKGR